MIPLRFWPYAIATGNTVVLKPSEQDPLTHQRVVELAVEAGFSPGGLNVVRGARHAVSAMLEHPGGKRFSVLGSSQTAHLV
jgi:malonate-semialdehyde dehydrogenase (acetylating)/methylmalonate-semialdehyde dehydrogenase